LASIQLKRTVAVKVIMTPAFRQQLIDEARETIARLDENLARLEAAVAVSTPAGGAATADVAAEQQRLLAMRGGLDWRIKEVESVSDGAEIPFRTIEGFVEVAVGDNFLHKMSQAEIVMRDWEVVEIRQR
jgi:hypothetical protein